VLRSLILALAISPTLLAQPPACLDARNQPVTIHEVHIADFGRASLDKAGKPVIFLDAPLLKRLPPSVGKFILYHECGHHALGHLLGVGSALTDEAAADCWAVRLLTLTGQFDANDTWTAGENIARLNHPMMNAEPGAEPWRAANLRACVIGLPVAAVSPEQDELDHFIQWPMISSQSAGTHFFLRTRLKSGVLQYVATVTDNKGRSAKYFAETRSRGVALSKSTAPNLFQIAFSNGSASRLYTVTISDSMFQKIADSGFYEAIGESPCTEEVYRAMLQGLRESAVSARSSHSWIVPAELR